MSLRKATIAASDHAVERWQERIGGVPGAANLVDAVRKARIIPRGEPIPLLAARAAGLTYAVYGPAVFLLRSESARHFELITVMRALGA
jgi:hypothetical protein